MNFARNKIHRRKQRQLFDTWRSYSHKLFLQKLHKQEEELKNKQASLALKEYQGKVDALLLYVQQLEDKIRGEQEQQKELQYQYESYIAQGGNS